MYEHWIGVDLTTSTKFSETFLLSICGSAIPVSNKNTPWTFLSSLKLYDETNHVIHRHFYCGDQFIFSCGWAETYRWPRVVSHTSQFYVHCSWRSNSLGLALSGLTNLSPILGYLVKVRLLLHLWLFLAQTFALCTQYLASAENGSVSVSRIHEIATLPPEHNEDRETRIPPKEWPHKGEITFQQVELRYKWVYPRSVQAFR